MDGFQNNNFKFKRDLSGTIIPIMGEAVPSHPDRSFLHLRYDL